MKVYKTLPNGINVVEYESGLAQALADMWNASGDSWGGDTSVRTAAEIETDLSVGNYLNLYVAEKDGEALGFASLSKYFADNDALYLHVLNVRPDYHGHKLGKALVMQCVERTIELGYPRLDIHTWPGNTKAVPVYKKCGYMWEDRVDSTHLVNFVPTVLKTEACGGFFESADWYEDNARAIEIKPDGVKLNKFEVFEYKWEKDGSVLVAGFERTGRRMRLLETDDFRLEMTAETHEPAFGLEYSCSFEAINKTGKPLKIKITGKDDKNIIFKFEAECEIEKIKTLAAKFFVGEITEPQDIWRVHPCVLADVCVNGLRAEFGMGVETKWPVSLEVVEQKRIVPPGTNYDCRFNLTSALSQDAQVTLGFGGNGASVCKFDFAELEAEIKADGKKSLKARAEAVGTGHEAVPVEYNVRLADGREINYVRPYHFVSQGFDGAFYFEDEKIYGICNGPYSVKLDKNGSYARSRHVGDKFRCPDYPAGQLGKPYGDEFTRMKPVRVKAEKLGGMITMEAAFESETFAGALYTEIFSLSSNGVFKRRHRVENAGSETLRLSLKDEIHPPLGDNAVIPYDGGIQTITDGLIGGAFMLDADRIDENWAYDDDPRSPGGICWPREYKINVRWGDCLFFEHGFEIGRGESFETKDVVYVGGHFDSFGEFRDYATQAYNAEQPSTVPHLGFELNGRNPFSENVECAAEIIQRRRGRLEGEISVSSEGKEFTEDENKKFTLRRAANENDPVERVTLRMNTTTFDNSWTKISIPANRSGGEVKTLEENGVYKISNGAITFKNDPRFSDACFSLCRDGREWLMTNYPSREPFAWYNPFIGGIKGNIENMRDAMVIREKIESSFASEADAFGNVWTGIKSEVTVENYDECKGIAYAQYYMTLPGIPAMCHFARIRNETGHFRSLWFNHSAFFGCMSGEIKNLTVSGKGADGTDYRWNLGFDGCWRDVERLMKIENKTLSEKLYFYRNPRSNGSVGYDTDVRCLTAYAGFRAEIENGGVFTSRPAFYIFTPKDLDYKMFEDFDGVVFA